MFKKPWILIVLILLGSWIAGAISRASPQATVLGDGVYSALVVPVANLFLNLFNSPSTALTLCVAMAASGLALFLYYFLGRISPTLRELDNIAFELRMTPSRAGNIDSLAAIDTIMQDHPMMSRSWKLYRATLITDANGRITAPFPPARYLNMRALEHSGLKLRFFLGMPNDFVGIGLIFTFLGLIAGLYFASKSMLSANLADARNALTLLLHAATFKFLTSITGIGISMMIAGAQRILLDQLQSGLNEVQYLIEERIPPSDAGKIPSSQQDMTQVFQQPEKNVGQLRTSEAS